MTYSEKAGQYIGVRQGSKKHKHIIDTYNQITPLPRGYRVTYTDNWCATFVSFVLKICKCRKKVFECSAQRMMLKCKKYLIDDNTKGCVNDIIFYDWDSNNWCDHVGIISNTDGRYYKVIEGNKDKKVGVRIISKKSRDIYAIARL